jgi:IMP dehydrogenase
MNQNPVSMPAGTSIADAYNVMQMSKQRDLPLIDVNNCVVGMYAFSDVDRIMTNSQENYNVDPVGRLRVGAAIGTGKKEIERAVLLVESGADVIVIDTAHGDSRPVYDTLKVIKEHSFLKGIDVVVGNISEGDSAKRLVEAGADGIKVGQGPGSICTTRIVAGIGCPQVTAIRNCSTAILDSDIPICADGGIEYSGDIPIALGAGADSVMLGGLLAGTDEAPGQIVNIKGIPYKTHRGMGSVGAMLSSETSRQRYGQEEATKDRLVPEGVEGIVPCRGKVESQIHQLLEGLRRGMGYVGASTIQELQDKAKFYRITPAGLRESHPHGVIITADMPNYQGGTRP